MSDPDTHGQNMQTGYGRSEDGYHAPVGVDDEARRRGQRLTSGRSEATPFIALGSVTVVIATLVAVAVALAALAYFLA